MSHECLLTLASFLTGMRHSVMNAALRLLSFLSSRGSNSKKVHRNCRDDTLGLQQQQVSACRANGNKHMLPGCAQEKGGGTFGHTAAAGVQQCHRIAAAAMLHDSSAGEIKGSGVHLWVAMQSALDKTASLAIQMCWFIYQSKNAVFELA